MRDTAIHCLFIAAFLLIAFLGVRGFNQELGRSPEEALAYGLLAFASILGVGITVTCLAIQYLYRAEEKEG
jgi:TRAP-type C4-dicarboxylate transport system permease small subunit